MTDNSQSGTTKINWELAWRYARFEMRGSSALQSISGALMLGVAAIAQSGQLQMR